MTNSNLLVVTGNGWAALSTVAILALRNQNICWIKGTSSSYHAPLDQLERGKALNYLAFLCKETEILCDPEFSSTQIREYKNHAFKKPNWTKDGVLDAFWRPEIRLFSKDSYHLNINLLDAENLLRDWIQKQAHVRTIEGMSISQIEFHTDGGLEKISLPNKEEILTNRLFYCDSWHKLVAIEGMPRGLPFMRLAQGVGMLQVTFTHSEDIGQGFENGIYSVVNKDVGETIERHVFGYFPRPNTSLWTFLLPESEVEDNKQIAKKIRKIKQSLDRTFQEMSWAQGKKGFIGTISTERYKFIEEAVFVPGIPLSKPLLLSPEAIHHGGVAFLTDGYGVSSSLIQCAVLFEDEFEFKNDLVNMDQTGIDASIVGGLPIQMREFEVLDQHSEL